MNKIVLKSLLSLLLFVVLAIFIEMVQFSYLDFGVFPKYFLYDFGIILMLGFFVFSITNQVVRNIVMSIILGFQIILVYANMCIYKNLGTIFSFDMLTLTGETFDVVEKGVFLFWPIPIFLIFIATFVLGLVGISKIKVQKSDERRFNSLIFLSVSIVGILSSFAVAIISQASIKSSISSSSVFTDAFLYDTFYSSNQALRKFGSYPFYTENLFRTILGIESQELYSLDDAILYKKSSEYDPKSSSLFGLCQEDGRKDDVIVILAESFEWYAISKELTPVLYALSNGYDFSSLNVKGGEWFYNYQYKDLDDRTYHTFRNENLIYDETLEDEFGLSLVNYYSKAKTDQSETSLILGNYPFGEGYTEHIHGTSTGIYEEINYSFSLPSMLKNGGYETNYFHTWKKAFYGRDVLMPMFGFQNTMFIEDMGLENYSGTLLRDGTLDSAFMQKHIDEVIGKGANEPYLSFFTSVSTHGSYYDRKAIFEDIFPIVEDANWLRTEDENHNSSLETYFAGALDLEYAVSFLVYNLILEDKLDNTILVFCSDHNCYYDNNDLSYKSLYYSNYYKENMGENYHWAVLSGDLGTSYSEKATARYCVPAFIYSTRITDEKLGGESHYITKTTQAFDIIPTILTLLGIDFQTSLYMGYPIIFDRNVNLENNAVISFIDGVLNKDFYSDDGSEISYSRPSSTGEEKEAFIKSAAKLMEKWLKISSLYRYNMFD